jgi:hypothetical protein
MFVYADQRLKQNHHMMMQTKNVIVVEKKIKELIFLQAIPFLHEDLKKEQLHDVPKNTSLFRPYCSNPPSQL